MKLKNVLLKQQGTSDCGVTSLRMLLAYVQHDINYLTIAMPDKLDNFLALSNVALKHGVELIGYNVSDKGALDNIKGPFIAQLSRGGTSHFVVAEIKGRKIHVNDPSGDYYVLPYVLGGKYFISNLLVVNYVEKMPRVAKPALPRNYLLIGFQILFLALITLGFLFLGDTRRDLLSYLAFTLAALIKILEQHALLASVGRFDKAYTLPFLARQTKDFKRDYQAFQQAKVTLMTHPLAIFNAITTVLFMSVLLILNNILLLIICALLIIVSFFMSKAETTKRINTWTLTKLEADLIKSNGDNRRKTYEKMMHKTENTAKLVVYRNIIIHFLLGVLIFVLMYFSETYSLNFFLFYFFGFAYYYRELQKLFTLVTNRATYYAAINTIMH